jgi:hypothetical protein
MSGELSNEELERQIREKQDELNKLKAQLDRQKDKEGFWSNLWSWIETIAPKIKKVLEHAKDILAAIAAVKDIIKAMS